jgi:DNA invertase Pin-like site-specific DNA recombinase
MLIGYARVSSTGHPIEVQHQALKAAGCEKVFQEKVSGARSDRAELLKAIAKVNVGDVLVVTRLDRLARSTLDLLRTIDQINKIGAGFKSLADAWCDTTTPHGRLMLTVLGGLAFERSLILQRTTAGRVLAGNEELSSVGRRSSPIINGRKH